MSEVEREQVGRVHSAYEGSVPLGTKLAYAVGATAESTINFAFNVFNFFFYTNVLGLPGTLAGLAITIALIADAITDPLIGGLSDRWRSRLGRRHPFMFAAPIPLALWLFLIYSPPDFGATGLFIWLTVFSLLLRSTMTLFHVPHLALGAELSSDFTERTRVMSMNTLLSFAGGYGTIFIGYTFFFTPSSEYANGLLDRSHYPYFAIFASMIGAGVMLVSALCTRHVIPLLPQSSESSARLTVKEFGNDILLAIKNSNYLMMLVGILLLSATLGTRQTVELHAQTYYWELIPEQIRYFSLVGISGPVLAFLSAVWLHERYEKKATLIGVLVGYAAFASFPVLLRLAGIFPEPGNAWLLHCLLAFHVGQTTCAMLSLITAASMLADIADEQELATGLRQEGVFYSARSFFGKASSGFGHLVAGVALDLIRFPVGAEPGTVPADQVLYIGLLEGPIAAIPGLLSVVFYLRFNLTRAKHKEIQIALANRTR